MAFCIGIASPLPRRIVIFPASFASDRSFVEYAFVPPLRHPIVLVAISRE